MQRNYTHGENPLGPLEEMDDEDYTPKISKT